MLTPIEIQGKTFKNGMGYSKADVDTFVSALSSDYEALYKNNIELKEQINTLNDALNHYKEIEKSLQKALVLAETTAEETIAASRKNAMVIEQEAVLKAQGIVADAKVELDKLHGKTLDMLQQYNRYKSQYKALAASQLELLNSEAFNIEAATVDAFSKLNTSASEGMSELTSEAVYSDATSQAAVAEMNDAADTLEDDVSAEDDEDDLDETLSADAQIKDLSEIFNDDDQE